MTRVSFGCCTRCFEFTDLLRTMSRELFPPNQLTVGFIWAAKRQRSGVECKPRLAAISRAQSNGGCQTQALQNNGDHQCANHEDRYSSQQPTMPSDYETTSSDRPPNS